MDAIQNMKHGQIKISEDVIKTIAALTVTRIEGIAGMSGGLAGGIAEILGKKTLFKGTKLTNDEKGAFIDLYIIVEYGTKIPDIAWEIQDEVKKSVYSMTNLVVDEVNIHVQGVNF
ncbi:MAG: Asp23/Gls24 family envelope stress response protein [Alkaliphilus sp.]